MGAVLSSMQHLQRTAKAMLRQTFWFSALIFALSFATAARAQTPEDIRSFIIEGLEAPLNIMMMGPVSYGSVEVVETSTDAYSVTISRIVFAYLFWYITKNNITTQLFTHLWSWGHWQTPLSWPCTRLGDVWKEKKK